LPQPGVAGLTKNNFVSLMQSMAIGKAVIMGKYQRS